MFEIRKKRASYQYFGAARLKQRKLQRQLLLFLLTKNDATYTYYLNHTTPKGASNMQIIARFCTECRS